jgi:hypothetical protein
MLGLKNVLMFVIIFQLGTVYAQTLEIEKNYTEEMAEEVTDITQDELQEGKFFSEIDPEKLSHLEEEYQNEIGDNPIQAGLLKLKCTCGWGECRTVITITFRAGTEAEAKRACERACEKMGPGLYENDFRKMEVVAPLKEVN